MVISLGPFASSVRLVVSKSELNSTLPANTKPAETSADAVIFPTKSFLAGSGFLSEGEMDCFPKSGPEFEVSLAQIWS